MNFNLNPAALLQSVRHRTDAKLYRLQTPQTPIARTQRYDEYHMDEFPSGTNMIVAVLAYTGPRCTSILFNFVCYCFVMLGAYLGIS